MPITKLRGPILLLALALAAEASASAMMAMPGAPGTQANTLSPAAQKADLRVVRTALEESQVGLHWYVSRPALDRAMSRLESRLDCARSPRDFYGLLLPLIASLGHGHTVLEPPVDSASYRLRRLDKAGRYFPAETRLIEGRLFVLRNLGKGEQPQHGAEILSINGTAVNSLMPQMLSRLSADGLSLSSRTWQLGEGWRFHDLLDLLEGPRTDYRLRLQPPGGAKAVNVIVSAVSPASMALAYHSATERELDLYPPALSFRMVDDHTGLLTVSSFYEGLLPKGTTSFAPPFAAAFAQLAQANARSLVIDVRGNEGGNLQNAVLLASYITRRPFAVGTAYFTASPRLSTLAFVEGASDEVKAFANNPLDFVSRDRSGLWVLKPQYSEDVLRRTVPRPEAFQGRVTILVDGGSFSATNAFVDLARRDDPDANRITFVGQENGGDNRFPFSSGGQSIGLRLPNSGLRLSIPILGTRKAMATGKVNRPVPDRRVTATIKQLLNGKDPVLEAALREIAIR